MFYSGDSHCLSTALETDLKGRCGDLQGKKEAFWESDGKRPLPREVFYRMTLKNYCSWASQSSYLRVTSLLKEKEVEALEVLTGKHLGSFIPDQSSRWSWVTTIQCKCLIHKLFWSVQCRQLDSVVPDLLRLYCTTKWVHTVVMKKISQKMKTWGRVWYIPLYDSVVHENNSVVRWYSITI